MTFQLEIYDLLKFETVKINQAGKKKKDSHGFTLSNVETKLQQKRGEGRQEASLFLDLLMCVFFS